jgi:hypothetical protein
MGQAKMHVHHLEQQLNEVHITQLSPPQYIYVQMSRCTCAVNLGLSVQRGDISDTLILLWCIVCM